MQISVPGQPTQLVIADLDGDRRPDLLVALPEPGFVLWLRNLGGFVFQQAILLSASVSAIAVHPTLRGYGIYPNK